jgi:hypothetical protein
MVDRRTVVYVPNRFVQKMVDAVLLKETNI